jgi:DNA-directed RNA polymerase subunit M/transcription elongation factor TFIIS
MHTCKCGGIIFPRVKNDEETIWECPDCRRYEAIIKEQLKQPSVEDVDDKRIKTN